MSRALSKKRSIRLKRVPTHLAIDKRPRTTDQQPRFWITIESRFRVLTNSAAWSPLTKKSPGASERQISLTNPKPGTMRFTSLAHVVVRIETMSYYPGLFLACRKRVVTLRGGTVCHREVLSASGSAQGLLRYTELKTHRQITAK